MLYTFTIYDNICNVVQFMRFKIIMITTSIGTDVN